MPTDEYAPLVRGGLKLKGGKPTGVTKKKKKKEKEKSKLAASAAELEPSTSATNDGEGDNAVVKKTKRGERDEEEADGDEIDLKDLDPRDSAGKTATERAYDEMRRKRLEDRISREGGAKTHKQRVEELNKYLSNLSEHHDMPRIGPG